MAEDGLFKLGTYDVQKFCSIYSIMFNVDCLLESVLWGAASGNDGARSTADFVADRSVPPVVIHDSCQFTRDDTMYY